MNTVEVHLSLTYENSVMAHMIGPYFSIILGMKVQPPQVYLSPKMKSNHHI